MTLKTEICKCGLEREEHKVYAIMGRSDADILKGCKKFKPKKQEKKNES